MLHAQGHDLSAQVGVGPRVVVEAAVEGAERPVARGAETVVHARGMALVAGQEALLAVPPHLDGPAAGVHGGQREKALDRGAVLAAEGPAQVGADDADPVHRKAQGVADLPPVAEGGLGGDDQDDLPVGLLPGRRRFPSPGRHGPPRGPRRSLR